MMIKEKKKVKWQPKEKFGHLSEAFSTGMQLSVVSEDGRQIAPWMHCKDYLHDMIGGAVNKKKVEIYGFCYDPKSENQPCLKKVRLLAANHEDKHLRDKIENCADFLNQVEDLLDIEHTIVQECDAPPGYYQHGGVWYFEGDYRWLRSAPMLSMYALFIRVGMSHTKGVPFRKTIDGILSNKIKAYQQADYSNLSGCRTGIEYIFRHGDKVIFHPQIERNYDKSVVENSSTLHNYFGIVGFSNKNCASMKHWYRKEIERTLNIRNFA